MIAKRGVFFARRAFAEQNPELLQIVVESLDAADRWIEHNPAEAQLLVTEGGGYKLVASAAAGGRSE